MVDDRGPSRRSDAQPSRSGLDPDHGANRRRDGRASRDRTGRPRQLSEGDAVFVSLETQEAPSHIAGLTILDPAGDAGFGFDRYIEILRERIELVERFKWRLREVPLGLDRAYWVKDERFDLAAHVERVALPRPGNADQLAAMASFLHAAPLDRGRPLWECWWIEGLADGRVATLLKIHHALMDGESGVGLSEVLMDLSPDPVRDLRLPEDQHEPAPRPPTWRELSRSAVVNGLRRPRRVAVHASRALRDGLVRALDGPSERTAPRVPALPFNARLGSRRSFAFTTVPLAPLRDVRKRYDVKLNDVLLALVSAAVRRVLLAEGKLPEESVVALCPVSLRTEDDAQFGNQLTSMPVSLATDREDPIERLLAIHRSTDAAKERVARGAFEMLTALGEVFVPGALRVVARAAHRLSDRLPLPANFVFSNVRAVPVPLYQAGARVEGLFPMSMLQVANGLNVTAVSHGDQVDFGFLTDAGLIEDPWAFARGIGLALEELESLSGAHLERERRQLAREPFSEAAESPPTDIAPPRRSNETRPPPEPAEAGSVPSWADEEGEDDLLDLHLIMAGLGHLRTPSRAPIARLEEDDD